MSHSGRPSTIQRKRLLELVRLNYAQLTGRLTAAGNAKRRRKWIEIASELNNVRDIAGSVRVVKSSEQWKRCWTDIRLKTIAKLGKNDLREVEFTSDDEAVIDICGPIGDGEKSDDENGRNEWGKGRLHIKVPITNELRNSVYTPSTSSSSPAIIQNQPLPYRETTPIPIHPPFTSYISTELNHTEPVVQPPSIKFEDLQEGAILSRSLSPEIFENSNAENNSDDLQREMVGNLQTIVDMLAKLISKADSITEITSVPNQNQSKSSSSCEKNDHSKNDYLKKKMTKNDFFQMCKDALNKDTENMNEYDLVGQNVAKKLQRMDPNQALFAECIINITLKRGLLHTLTGGTTLSERI